MKKLKYFFQKFFKNLGSYIITNRLFCSFVIICFTSGVLLKLFTTGRALGIRSIVPELGIILILGSFGYLFKPKNQYNYFFTIVCIITILCVVNSIYYSFYATFASVGELASLSQVETVTGSVFEKLKIWDLVYILLFILFIYIHKKLKNSSYYEYISKVEKGTSLFVRTLLIGVALIGIRFSFATEADYSSLAKQWNRSSVVQRFGIIIYQGNDIVQSLTPKLSSLFGYDDAVAVFNNFYDTYGKKEEHKNSYTGVFEGMNIVFVHMEGVQTLLTEQTFKDGELTPNLNKLIKEGTMFNNFYPQISTGTSSDSEFTLLSSMMPAASGTIFVSYYNRDYITTPKLLTEKGYYTFSMHGNASTMWNRNKAHPSLGYQEMYFKDKYTFDDEDVINLGINDKLFFNQALSYMENIEDTYENYMGTIITLSNHSPFTFLEKYGEFDLTKEFEVTNPETLEKEIIEDNYLEGTSVGNYFHSAHYSDEALGEFLEYIKNSEYFNNTVFVFYGDHDVKLGKNKINILYNYDPVTKEYYHEGDDGYTEFDSFDYELSKNTPLIIWTKNKNIQKKLPKSVDYVTGMYDVMPTIGNMAGFNNEYALGHDIFEIKDENIVVFPNGNFVTKDIYYNASTGDYKILKEGIVLDEEYINDRVKYVDDVLGVSNAIVIYDLLNDTHLKEIEEIDNEK